MRVFLQVVRLLGFQESKGFQELKGFQESPFNNERGGFIWVFKKEVSHRELNPNWEVSHKEMTHRRK